MEPRSRAVASARPGVVRIDCTAVRPVGTIDRPFQSYNVEMAEVIGGSFWKPYGKETERSFSASGRARRARHRSV